MAQLEKQLKAVYYNGFEDNYEGIRQVLDGVATNDVATNDEIWLLWLPHKPLSNMIMQSYGNIKIDAAW